MLNSTQWLGLAIVALSAWVWLERRANRKKGIKIHLLEFVLSLLQDKVIGENGLKVEQSQHALTKKQYDEVYHDIIEMSTQRTGVSILVNPNHSQILRAIRNESLDYDMQEKEIEQLKDELLIERDTVSLLKSANELQQERYNTLNSWRKKLQNTYNRLWRVIGYYKDLKVTGSQIMEVFKNENNL